MKQQEENQRRGASLPNVAGAVAAVVLLAISLLPALASVRKSSKDGACLTHLMQIGFANTIYASQDANDMALPIHPMYPYQCPSSDDPSDACTDPIFVGAYEWGGKSGLGSTDNVLFPGSTDPFNSKYGTKAGFGPSTRPLNSILYPQEFPDWGGIRPGNPLQYVPIHQYGVLQDTQLQLAQNRCPSDTGFTGIHCADFAAQELSSYDHFGTSYSANVFMTASGAGPASSNSPYLHRMSDILSPSTTIAYQENNGRFAWAAAPDPCPLFPIEGIPGTVRGWHGRDWTFNAAFIDGHADTIYMRGYKNPDPGRVDPVLNSCIIVRGEGWQIDTLPLPAVASQYIFDGTGRPTFENCIVSGSSQQAASRTTRSGTKTRQAAGEPACAPR